ncbi:DUF6415 family natural product biosynthesis protein [Streptomyces sp. NPDC020883]|uniref:DUF6415 family natural product biosynthesis protein n=1 Tax=Streptomyces sp. NPDC020883 TaxID=3365099 RepID=UPI003792A85E
MDTEQAPGSTATKASGLPPVDAETIAATIRQALQFGASQPGRDVLAETDETLRGHVALLLDVNWKMAANQPNSFENYQLRKRLERIAQHMTHTFGQGALTVEAEVHQRARDCQWLLAQHTARVGW